MTRSNPVTTLPDADDIRKYRKAGTKARKARRFDAVRDDLRAWAEANTYRRGFIPDFAWSGEPETPGRYMLYYYTNRDADLLVQSNAAYLEKFMLPYTGKERAIDDGRDAELQRHTHWAVGHVDCIVVRLFRSDGELTGAALALAELCARLDAYPVLDDDDLSEHESNATWENVTDAVKWALSRHNLEEEHPAEETTQAVYSWLIDNKPEALESREFDGAYPDDKDIDDALRALAILEPEGE